MPDSKAMTSVDLRQGDCLAVLRDLPDNSVDAVVTDPPYGLSNTAPQRVADTIARWASGDTEYVPEGRGYLGQAWDGFVPPPAVWEECMRVLKPGGHMAVFAGARTQDLMGLSIRLAGFDIRDTLAWIQGGGFPRSRDYGQLLAQAGHEELGEKYWDWRSVMKPANEPIVLARKPLTEPSITRNIAEHGTGALNIGDTRYGEFFAARANAAPIGRALLDGCHNMEHLRQLAKEGKKCPDGRDAAKALHRIDTFHERYEATPVPKPGRWPANVIMDEDAADSLGDNAKFFYCSRIQKRDIPKAYNAEGELIQHQTVKPLTLMEWLVTLITPPGGTVLDPFAGSGTTLEAARNKNFNAIGIEREPDYCELIHHRLDNDRPHLP